MEWECLPDSDGVRAGDHARTLVREDAVAAPTGARIDQREDKNASRFVFWFSA
jgi:hypothetical protein